MFNLSLRALGLKQKQEVSIKFTEVKRVSNCKKTGIFGASYRLSGEVVVLWVTDLITPINSDRTCGPGGGSRPLSGVNCRFCVWDGKSLYLRIQISLRTVRKETYKKCPGTDHTKIS